MNRKIQLTALAALSLLIGSVALAGCDAFKSFTYAPATPYVPDKTDTALVSTSSPTPAPAPAPAPATASTQTFSAPPPAPPVTLPPVTPVPPAAGSKDADDAFVAGRYAEAFSLYQQRVQRNPYDLDAHDGVTASAVKMGKVKDAVKWYDNAPSGHPGWCYGAARAVLTDGDRKMASALCYRALDTNRGLGRVYFLLGLLYETQSVPDYKATANAFNRAIDYDPKFGPTYFHLAKLEAGVNHDIPRAQALIGKSLLYLTPVQDDVRFLTLVLNGGLLSSERDYAGALKQFQAARDLAGDAVYEHANIGRVYELMGDTEGAVKEWTGVQQRFGLASSTGIMAFRNIRRVKSKVAIDYSDFLPGATDADYALLVTHLARTKRAEVVPVPASVAKMLDDIKVPVRVIESDVDGDGKLELTIVEAKDSWDPDIKGYYLARPVAHVFTSKGGAIGYYDSNFDQFLDIRLIDFPGDGKKEVVFTGFTSPNVLNVLVMTHQGRRLINTYAQTIPCLAAPCGVLIDDLDGDGKMEIMSVEGPDLWVTVRRWNDAGTFTDACADFPDFYRDYVKKYESLNPEELAAWPVVKRHLADAHAILLQSAGKKTETSADKNGNPPAPPVLNP